MPHSIHASESLSNFASDPARYLERLRQSGEPILLTVEGEDGIVVQDAASYRRFLELMDRLETLAAVKQGLADVSAGRTRRMREALEELAHKHGLSPVEGE